MTVQSVTTGSFSSPTVLNRDGHKTVVLATVQASPNEFIQLPSGCLPDDVFEIYWTPLDSSTAAVLAPSGENFGTSGGSPLTSLGGDGSQSKILKKLTNTVWGFINSTP